VLTVICPTCREQLTAPDHLAGKNGVCPKCRATVPIPAHSEQFANIGDSDQHLDKTEPHPPLPAGDVARTEPDDTFPDMPRDVAN
jgi:hypothetical protein